MEIFAFLIDWLKSLPSWGMVSVCLIAVFSTIAIIYYTGIVRPMQPEYDDTLDDFDAF